MKVNDIGSHSTLFFFFGWNLNGQPEQTILHLEIGRWESFRFMFLVLHWAVKAENRYLLPFLFCIYINILNGFVVDCIPHTVLLLSPGRLDQLKMRW